MTQGHFFSGAALLMLAACDANPAANGAADNGANAAATAIETLPPDESTDAYAGGTDEATNQAGNATEPATAAAVIPAQYRGRWGMVAADCTSTRGDAKGLITVADKTIRFYESTATLKEQRPAIATSFSGLFGFTGEGQTWDRVETLTRTGDTLKRADEQSTATYKRCG